MSHSIRAAAAATLVAAVFATPALAADRYLLDPEHTQTIFAVDHLGYSTVTGNFHDVKGVLILDETRPEASTVEVTVGTASIDTDVASRDEDLRSANFFDVARFPAMTFKSTRVRKTGARTADVQGDLTLLGITKPIKLKVRFNQKAPDPLRGNATVAGFTATTAVKRSDFGMKTFVPLIGDVVNVTINAEGIKQ